MPKYRILSHWEGQKRLWVSHKEIEAPTATSAKKKAQADSNAWQRRIKKRYGKMPPKPIVGKVRLIKGK